MPYAGAEELFATNGALTDHARRALARMPNGQPTEEKDTEFLLALDLACVVRGQGHAP